MDGIDNIVEERVYEVLRRLTSEGEKDVYVSPKIIAINIGITDQERTIDLLDRLCENGRAIREVIDEQLPGKRPSYVYGYRANLDKN